MVGLLGVGPSVVLGGSKGTGHEILDLDSRFASVVDEVFILVVFVLRAARDFQCRRCSAKASLGGAGGRGFSGSSGDVFGRRISSVAMAPRLCREGSLTGWCGIDGTL